MTRDIFLYGTLRDPGQLTAVLGHDGWTTRPDALEGHAVVREAATAEYPVLVAAAGAVAEGAVITVGGDDLARLDWYEAAFGYDRRAVTLASGARADVYWPPAVETLPEPWDLAAWVAAWGAVVEEAAGEAMARFPDTPPGDVGRRFGMLMARAASRRRAAGAAANGAVRRGMGRKGVGVLRAQARHRGFFALDELTLDHRRFDGGREEVVREVFVGTDAALVLPYDPVRDEVVLVEQFRAGPWRRGDPQPWCLEPVAGLIDPGESPEDCARRETREEAGLELRGLVPVPGGYPSPGATTEYYFLYVGLADLAEYRPRTTGLAAEGEDILTHVLGLSTALSLLETGEATVLPLAHLLCWTAAHRPRLAAAAGIEFTPARV